jgi:CspA family cold shock protein
MSTGTVKSFDRAKGYGFIRPDDGSRDVYVHASTVERAGMPPLEEGQKLSYILRHDPTTRKNAASDLRARP